MNSGGGFGVANILMMGVFFVEVYFLLIRTNEKKRRQEDEMRRSLKVGDEIVTAGGIVGRIVSIKEGADTFIIETGVDRSKIKIKRWAILGCNTEKTQEIAKSSEKGSGSSEKRSEKVEAKAEGAN